jgi:hypothetical protein
MRSGISVSYLAAACAAVVSLSSCQNFFTTSLGEVFARDPEDLVPKVTASNAEEVAETVKSDPDASLAVLESLSELVSKASTTEKKAELATLALEVSANASGVSGAFLDTFADKTDLLKDGDFENEDTKAELFSVIDDALSGLDNLDDSAENLETILTSGVSVDTVKETASADQMAMAAIVLLSNNATSTGTGSVSDYVDELGDKDVAERSESETLAIDLAEAAKAKYAAEGGTGPLADILNALNLTGV